MSENNDSCLGGVDLNTPFLRAEANIPGVAAIISFYALVLGAGILGSFLVMRKKKKKKMADGGVSAGDGEGELSKVEDIILAGRDMGMVVGSFTLSASLVGGALVNGTPEIMLNKDLGFVWAQAPVFFLIGFPLATFVFGAKMRKQGCRTMLDPVRNAFGEVQGALLCLPSVIGDVFWTASILSALGASFSVIVGMNYIWGVVISEAVSILYTFAGGLYSVAYTDIIELVCLFGALVVAVPFAMTHEAVSPITDTAHADPGWLGSAPTGASILLYIDVALTLSLGGICCWQCIYQRVLAQKTIKGVYVITMVGFLLSAMVLTPVVLVGAVAYSTDWNATGYRDFGSIPIPACDYPLALPIVMRFLTPTPVAVIGLGAVSAAVMSSTDSAALSSASLVTLNCYSPLREAISGKKGSAREMLWVMRATVLVVGITATIIAIFVTKTYGLLVLSVDFLYLSFPQLITSLYMPFCNAYGSFVTFWLCILLRLLSGEPLIDLPPIITFPYYDAELDLQNFPFRTLVVIIGLIVLILVSLLTRWCARHSACFRAMDRKTFKCFIDKSEKLKSAAKYTQYDIDENGKVNNGFLPDTTSM